jgi:hypothetical protein
MALYCVTSLSSINLHAAAGKYRNNKPGPRPLVLLHHGITLSSACFTLLNANESMAYILADAGAAGWAFMLSCYCTHCLLHSVECK